MKRHGVSAALMMFAVLAVAAGGFGDTLVHQGELTELDGRAVADGVYPMSFSLWTDAEEGRLLWIEEHPAVAVIQGRFSVSLGSLVPLDRDVTGTWLEVTVAGDLLEPRTKVAETRSNCTVEGMLSADSIRILEPTHTNGTVLTYDPAWPALIMGNFAGSGMRFSTGTAMGFATIRLGIKNSGEVWIGNGLPSPPLNGIFNVFGRTYLDGGTDAGLADLTGYLVIGNEGATNLVFDDNEIMARNDGATSGLYLQHNGGDVYVNGVVVHSSDRRLKRDVRGLELGLDEVLRLRPVSFSWANREDGRRLGLVAQDVREVVDEVVYEDQDGMLGIAYENLVPVLVKAIQEQQVEIERLSRELDELRGEHESR